MNEPRPFRFSRAFRLRHRREFEAVYGARARVDAGPLVVHARPSDGGRSRLGLSVSRRIGTAVRRNRLKRLLRESFRLSRHRFPAHYDVVIAPRPHAELLSLDAYRELLVGALERLHATWTKRLTRRSETRAPDSGPAR